jgi:hypothetical protein
MSWFTFTLTSYRQFHCRFLLYYWNYPEESKAPSETHPATYFIDGAPVSHDWWLSIQVSRLIRFWAALLTSLLGLLVFLSGLPSGVGNIFAWVLGIFSATLAMLQFIPQIYRTYQSKVRFGILDGVHRRLLNF